MEKAAKVKAEHAEKRAELLEKLRQAEDDLLKATQAARELDSSYLVDPSWSPREEKEFRRFETIYKQQRENSSWQRVDSVVDPEAR